MRPPPDDPFRLVSAMEFEPAARRTLRVDGVDVDLCWLPERRGRRSRPGRDRAPFAACDAERIIATEAVWTAGGLALTPNLHPFAARQLLLWSVEPRREPDVRFLEVGLALAAAADGALLVNSIGAAASIPWAHAHLIGERQPFLPAIPLEPCAVEVPGDQVEVFRAGPAFPALLLALRGPVAGRARAAEHLLRLRTCPSFGLVDQDETTWLYPRTREDPAPDFPQALGSSELWGRWCYDDEAAFAAATPEHLKRALANAGFATPTA